MSDEDVGAKGKTAVPTTASMDKAASMGKPLILPLEMPHSFSSAV